MQRALQVVIVLLFTASLALVGYRLLSEKEPVVAKAWPEANWSQTNREARKTVQMYGEGAVYRVYSTAQIEVLRKEYGDEHPNVRGADIIYKNARVLYLACEAGKIQHPAICQRAWEYGGYLSN